nr:thioredoxin family protein [Candidatus Sigynarchaeota archaeon]
MKRIKTQTIFDKAVNFNGLTIIDFFMCFCPPCQKLKSILENIEKELLAENANAQMLTIEIDDLPEMSKKFKVAAVPALFFFSRGEEAGTRMIGLKEKPVILARIRKEMESLR